jgi:hypothetical protein
VANPIPSTVRNIHTSFFRHRDGFSIAIYFEASPEDVETLFAGSHFSRCGSVASAGWEHAHHFSGLEGITPLDLDNARRSSEDDREEGMFRDVVVSGNGCHVYVFVAHDSDARP